MDGGALVVLRSGELIQALARAALVDEYRLATHPIVLGSGRRLLPENVAMAKLQLVDAKRTTKGVIVATYRPA
jgi:dihydrofolate reductase